MKKILAIVLALVLALGLLTACGASSSSSSQAPAEESSSASTPASEPAEESVSGVVNVSGSTSMESVVLALGEAFKEMYPDVTVNYSGTGSGAGVEAAQTGTSDIGLSSRELKEEETAAGAVANVVAKDGVAVIVNPANGVEDLTVEQIADIFSGKITNWSELGGEDMEIAVYGREAGSGTRGNVAGNENAIGYASLSAVDETVKAVKVAGVECTEDTVKDGSYAIQRPFVMVTKEGTELSAAAQAFLDYAMSAEAAPIIAAAGAVSANA